MKLRRLSTTDIKLSDTASDFDEDVECLCLLLLERGFSVASKPPNETWRRMTDLLPLDDGLLLFSFLMPFNEVSLLLEEEETCWADEYRSSWWFERLPFIIFSKCVSMVWFDMSISRRCEVIPRIAGHCWSTLCPYPWSRNIQTTKRYFHVTCEDWEVIVEVHFAFTLGHRTYKTHKNIFMLLVLRLQINGGMNT